MRSSLSVLRHAILSAAGVAVVAGCVVTTPYDGEPDERDLTQKNLDALATRTPPKRFKFIALGDVHDEYDDLARTVDVINTRNDIEFVAIAGDMSDRGLRQELEWSQAIFARLRVPYLTAIGNHDAISSGAQIYRRMYGPLDYRFRFGGIEFVFFNSNSLEFTDGSAPNFPWIDAQLSAASDADGIVLVTHYPPVFPPKKPEGLYDPRRYDELFAKHEITLSVHSHYGDWGLTREHGAVSVQCSTFEERRYYAVITMEGRDVSIERCRFDFCEPVVPEEAPQ